MSVQRRRSTRREVCRSPSVSDCSALSSLPTSARLQNSRNLTEERASRVGSEPGNPSEISSTSLHSVEESDRREDVVIPCRSPSPRRSPSPDGSPSPSLSLFLDRSPSPGRSPFLHRSPSPWPNIDTQNLSVTTNNSVSGVEHAKDIWQGTPGTKWLVAALRLRPMYKTGEGRVKGAIKTAISKELREKYEIARTLKQCENHGSYWRTKWHDRQRLLSQSGFSTDEMGRITYGEEAWQAFIAKVSNLYFT